MAIDASHLMIKTTTYDPLAGHIHIDRITVNGPLEHQPIGETFYWKDPIAGVIAAGASAYTPKRRRNPLPDDLYIKSSDIQSNEMAYRLLFNCCPPQQLQGHNIFGHGDLLDYVNTILERQLAKHGRSISEVERDLWRSGRRITVSDIHLTGNFRIPAHLKAMTFDAIDQSNRSGKHRDIASCITLGFNETRRSNHHTVCLYDKFALLTKEWTKPGTYQSALMDLVDGTIRVEIRLHEAGLSHRNLKPVEAWADRDVDSLFFELLAGYDVTNSIQPILTEDEVKMLADKEAIMYLLWLHGEDIGKLFSKSTISRHSRSIFAKTQIDILSHRRPEKLPQLDLRQVLTPENLVPVPSWLQGTDRYWAPSR